MAGVIIDSSPFIRLERAQFTAKETLQAISLAARTDELSISSVAYTELLLGVYRADSANRAARRKEFLREIFEILPVHPYSRSMAEVAAKIRGEEMQRGNTLPLADSLIGATALVMNRAVLTTNITDFSRIPGLQVIPFRS